MIDKVTPTIEPFQNESDVRQICNLTIENRLDRVTIYGDLDITLDKEGFENLSKLMSQLYAIHAYMKHTDLPDKVEVVGAKTVPNPFAE